MSALIIAKFSKIIVKSILDPDEYFRRNSSALKG